MSLTDRQLAPRPVALAGSGSPDLGDANLWALASIVDTPDGLAVGDFGLLDGRVYARATLAVHASAGGGTLDLWVPPDVATWTSPTVYAHLAGDEDAVARAAQGWADSITGAATITGNVAASGWTRLEGTGGLATAGLRVLDTAVSALQKIYVRTLLAGQSEPGALAGAFIADGINAVRMYDEDDGFSFRGNTATVINPTQIRGGSNGVKLSAVPAGVLLEIVHEGPENYVTAWRDGAPYHATTRTNGTTTANRIEWLAYRGSSPTVRPPIIDLRHSIVIAGT